MSLYMECCVPNNGDSRVSVEINIMKRSYLVGAGIGILSWIVFVVVNAPLGITTALSEASGAVAMPL